MDLIDLKGIGKVTLEKFKNNNIKNLNDLIHTYPKKYEVHQLNTIDELELDKTLMLKVKVTKLPKIAYIRRKLTKLSVYVDMDNVFFQVHIFNREFLSPSLKLGEFIVITGNFLKNLNNFTASNIVLEKNYVQGIIPVYNIKNINDSLIKKALSDAFTKTIPLDEKLPRFILHKRNILTIDKAIKKIHFPQDENDISQAIKRVKYEELLDFAIKVESLKKLNQSITTPIKNYDIDLVKAFIRKLPFELTDSQKSATNDIFRDLKKSKQMNRLLQGDVGSGKTIVSILACLAVYSAGYQIAYMAPTLVLAKQHFQTFSNYLKDYNIKIGLLTSEQTSLERKELLNAIKKKDIDILIGTHSLIQDDIEYNNLGFIVIDEQHRFGVEQRKALRKKGIVPDILLMSATPIPRTLAISLLADIDVSSITEKPAGRKTVKTEIIEYEKMDRLIKTIEKEIEKNHQVYFICPLIQESENSSNISTEELLPLLNKKLNRKYSIDVLHGKMKDKAKEEVLKRFYKNETKILISTTVIEVGINVQNATVMVIMNANSFGLAQLHQLRGRIGRNEYQSYCYLVIDSQIEEYERLNILEKTDDGFAISEFDLKMRGPGEMFGYSQSGLPNFVMANIINDKELLDEAFLDAKEIISSKDYEAIKYTNKIIKLIDSYNLD